MTKIGIVGLGAMGLGIAQVFAQAGCEVIGTDQNADARATARERMRAALESRIKAGKLAPGDLDETIARLTITDDLRGFAGADMIIEAIIEDLAVKQALLRDLAQIARPDTVLATNTSALSVGAIAQGLRGTERVLGLHFFNPAPAMRLVELVAHAGTGRAALSTARTLSELAGKTVIQCADRPGFIVNRCARPYYGEALALLEEGHPAAEIDAAMQAAGYRLGPFALIDLIGADINLAATEGLAAAMQDHPRYHVFASLKSQVASGHLGRKTGQGFLHPATTEARANPAIAQRIEATLINEAAWLLAEGGTTPDGIDTAMKLGLNFPRGPFEALAHYGKPAIRATLAALAAAAPAPLQSRYAPAPFLTE